MKVFKLSENVTKYTFGNPINTDAVLIYGEKINRNEIEYLQVEESNGLKFTYIMSKEDMIFGLGENHRGMNKRGGIFESFCTDDPKHTPDKKSLYGAHNFFIVDGTENFGVFIDYPSKVTFDFGFNHKDFIEISIEDKNVDVYIIKEASNKKIVKEFLTIIGESYVPPKWAFGFQQSRWSYEDSKAVEKIADKFLEHQIPCDAIYLDIDYMERFKDFTVDENSFPNFKAFVKGIKEKGFRLIPIIDAGVKIEKGYEVYEEGVKNNYFCTDDKDYPFVAAVWPGRCHFPDFLNREARKWFGLKYKALTDAGIEGFWNDMNEPALFYTDRGLKNAIELAKKSEHENLDIYSFFKLKETFMSMQNNIEDYKSFYHRVNGEKINHYKVHNLYGYNMTRAASEGLSEIQPNKRHLLFSRASYIGMHRYGGIWTGDNCSWWDHLLLNIKMMPSLNMCGFLYVGADTGGFGENANGQLVTRWTQFSIFSPLFRNHAAMGTRNQEPFSFDVETNDYIKKAIEFRYALIPYLYSEYMKAVRNKEMYFSPLSFEYKDDTAKRIENQLLVGDSIMVSPIYEENSVSRYVYLPEPMVLWKVKNYEERNLIVLHEGHHYVNIAIDEIPIFIRKDKIIPLGKHGLNVDVIKNEELILIAFVEDKAEYTFYDDDGISFGYKNGVYSEIKIRIEKQNEEYNIVVNNIGNNNIKKLNFEIIDVYGNMERRTMELKKGEENE